MAMVSTSSSLVVPIPTKLVLGFQRSSSIRSEFSAISFFKLRAKASPSSSTHLSSSFRFENVKSSKRMKQRMPILFAKPSEGGDILKGKSEEATEPQGQGQGQGPPFLTILAGFAVFFFIAWILGSIVMWLISLIFTVSPK